MQASCQLRILDGGLVDAYCGWFDTRFKGSPENPTDFEVGALLTCCKHLLQGSTSVTRPASMSNLDHRLVSGRMVSSE